ncbi:hypothetical protein KUTeg_006454 [Tegillarca granosa]|uniref:Uncharacterized protein n=1 Tax=Tegillarca granosa TaxID=220873 RepID=A0ABQ9FL76_TEGGR|nr:hypothetical protein KUTeg_006454 [Tegillarca granosa]
MSTMDIQTSFYENFDSVLKRSSDSANNSSQESGDAITDMNNDSPGKRSHGGRALSMPTVRGQDIVSFKHVRSGSDQEKITIGETKDLSDNPGTPTKKSHSRQSSDSVDDKSINERSSVERSSVERSVVDGKIAERSGSNGSDKFPGFKMSEKIDRTSKSSDSSSRLSSGSITDKTGGVKVTDKASDHSRSGSEFTGGHGKERSFEKSLDNIMDKCSEKSLDLTLSVENRNEAVSDTGKSVEDACSTTSTGTKKSDKKKKNITLLLSPLKLVSLTELLEIPVANCAYRFLKKERDQGRYLVFTTRTLIAGKHYYDRYGGKYKSLTDESRARLFFRKF